MVVDEEDTVRSPARESSAPHVAFAPPPLVSARVWWALRAAMVGVVHSEHEQHGAWSAGGASEAKVVRSGGGGGASASPPCFDSPPSPDVSKSGWPGGSTGPKTTVPGIHTAWVGSVFISYSGTTGWVGGRAIFLFPTTVSFRSMSSDFVDFTCCAHVGGGSSGGSV